jgi:hypothetical protein
VKDNWFCSITLAGIGFRPKLDVKNIFFHLDKWRKKGAEWQQTHFI